MSGNCGYVQLEMGSGQKRRHIFQLNSRFYTPAFNSPCISIFSKIHNVFLFSDFFTTKWSGKINRKRKISQLPNFEYLLKVLCIHRIPSSALFTMTFIMKRTCFLMFPFLPFTEECVQRVLSSNCYAKGLGMIEYTPLSPNDNLSCT